MHFPDFIGIGAQRAGSTWLYTLLKDHQDLWLPPIKELHYFDRTESPPVTIKNRRYEIYLKMRLKEFRENPFHSELFWDFKYFLGSMNDTWYGRLFKTARKQGKVTGEITPAYGLLSEDTIKRIYSINPGIKILFIMRDPVERSWSQAVKHCARDRGKRADEVTESEYISFLDKDGPSARSDYNFIIEKWIRFIPREQFFIGFYDQINENPKELLQNIFCFLSVDPDKYNYKTLKISERVNVSSHGLRIPDKVYDYLVKKYSADMEILKKYGKYPSKWLERYRGK